MRNLDLMTCTRADLVAELQNVVRDHGQLQRYVDRTEDALEKALDELFVFDAVNAAIIRREWQDPS